MANKEHLEILNQGVEVWNKWRENNPVIQPDLSGICRKDNKRRGHKQTLFVPRRRRALFVDPAFSYDTVCLSHANLSNTNLHGCHFHHLEIRYANLKNADLSESHLFKQGLSRE